MHMGTAAAQPNRTIGLSANDQLRFTPDSINVHAGETVAFKIANTGTAGHEFVIGDVAAQDQHEQEMAKGGHMDMAHAGLASVEIPAGKTKTLVYTFAKPGTLLYGCHIAGHYAGGMQGTITVTE
jgi:uncharacterized cupredoxin-like copper-binding protein